jgi:Na+-driven multidrug efflux pump
MWTFRIGLSFLFGKFFGLGLMGVWLAMVSDWIFRIICFGFRYFSGKWQKAAIV